MLPINTSDGRFHDGNGSSIIGTIVTAGFQNSVQDEIINVIVAAGLVPSEDVDQLKKAIDKMIVAKEIDAYTKTEADERFAAKESQSGLLVATFGKTPPVGTLACNGGVVSRITYAELFSVIGVAYGVGDGSTTFNLPNFRAGDAILGGTAANVGIVTNGDNLVHAHYVGYLALDLASGNDGYWQGDIAGNGSSKSTTTSGSSRNLAAGLYTLICIKY